MAKTRTFAARSELVAEISGHLTRNPNAGDTAAGIWQCWLKTTRDKSDVQAVEEALESLVAEGKLRSRQLTSGELFYFARSPNGGDAGEGDN